MAAGSLRAERVGPHIRFTVVLPEGHDHVLVERHDGVDPKTGEAVWTPINGGHAMYARGVDGVAETWHRSVAPSAVPELTDSELPELPPGKYRALAFQRYFRKGTQVRLLRSADAYMSLVTV